MSPRSLAQIVLGMLAFALVVELLTALSNYAVDIGGLLFRPTPLLVALVLDVVALFLVSRGGKRRASDQRHDLADVTGPRASEDDPGQEELPRGQYGPTADYGEGRQSTD